MIRAQLAASKQVYSESAASRSKFIPDVDLAGYEETYMQLKPVITLNQIAFEAACGRLAKAISPEDFPDLVCGIITGGHIVAEAMMMNTELRRCKYISLKLQRPETKIKSSLQIDRFLKRLPRSLNNWLRITEDYLRERKFKRNSKPNVSNSQIEIAPEILEQLNSSKRILVIDDAVDTGTTLSAIVEVLRKSAPQSVISTAVITVTFSNPIIQPDYVLFRQTLVRFPWSADACP